MAAHDQDEKQFLPKEPLDLPRPHEELPAHATEVHEEQGDGGDPSKGISVTTLLSWHAPGRPFRTRSKQYFINIALIVLACVIIAFLFDEKMLILVVLSLGFLAYALALVPPHDFYYRISSEGLMVEDHFFLWQELYDFYIKQHEGEQTVQVRTKAYFPGELTLTLGDIHAEQVKTTLIPYLPFREYVKPTSMEKYGAWLSKTFPLDKKPS